MLTFIEKFNILWYDLWRQQADEILSRYRKNIVKMVKTQGYDGTHSTSDTTQWSFSGSLLYSVTVITTIGRIFSYKSNCHNNMSWPWPTQWTWLM
jgi:hypothetical protein